MRIWEVEVSVKWRKGDDKWDNMGTTVVNAENIGEAIKKAIEYETAVDDPEDKPFAAEAQSAKLLTEVHVE